MEPEVSETEFWIGKLVLSCLCRLPVTRRGNWLISEELQTIVSKSCDSEDEIDDALRAYLSITTQYKGKEIPF